MDRWIVGVADGAMITVDAVDWIVMLDGSLTFRDLEDVQVAIFASNKWLWVVNESHFWKRMESP